MLNYFCVVDCKTLLCIKVLREVHEQEIIEEIPEPIFSVSMILMTPSTRPSASHSHGERRGLHSAMRSVSAAHMKDFVSRKGVTFPERVSSAAPGHQDSCKCECT